MTARKRVALMFNDEPRPETTGGYCLRALRELVEVEHFRPGDLARLPCHGFDLYLAIDDGFDYIPEGLHPSAYWAIDTHIDFAAALAKSRPHDFVFAAQKDGAALLREAGIASTVWLPLACDPAIHRPHAVEQRFDLCFVGNVLPGPRAELLRVLRRRYSRMHVAQAYFDEMARTYSASKIVFNRSVRNDVNMRVFEALACGSLLVTNDLAANGQSDLFEPGVHLVSYASPDELCEQIDYYLAHPDERQRIAARGREEVIARHTYRQRMETILAAVGLAGATSPGSVDGWPASRPIPTTAGGVWPPQEMTNGAPVGPLNAETGQGPGPYFEFERPELLSLVPSSARRVLDVGCGAGRLGLSIKARQNATVWGIEQDPGAAEAAQLRLDRVLRTDVETLELAADHAPFDCIICGDVLEHVTRPLAVLRKLRTWLASDGVFVASIPNVRHHSVVIGLLEGNWTYESAGLLDRTHVRFFTKATVARLFQEAGLTIREWRHTSIGDYEAWELQGRPTGVRLGILRVECATSEETGEFFVYQHLVVAVANSSPTTVPDHLPGQPAVID